MKIDECPPVVLSFLTTAPFSLCCDTSEQYLAASVDVSSILKTKKKENFLLYI
jgi:hypothetical protein